MHYNVCRPGPYNVLTITGSTKLRYTVQEEDHAISGPLFPVLTYVIQFMAWIKNLLSVKLEAKGKSYPCTLAWEKNCLLAKIGAVVSTLHLFLKIKMKNMDNL